MPAEDDMLDALSRLCVAADGETATAAKGGGGAAIGATAARLGAALAASEWDEAELAQVVAQIQQLAEGEALTLRASSARRRRLVHYAAESLGLHHATVEGSQRGGHGAVRVTRLPEAAPCETCEPLRAAGSVN